MYKDCIRRMWCDEGLLREWAAAGRVRCAVYLVVPGLVATPVQQPFFNSDGAGLQRGVGELEVGLRRRARALRAQGRTTTGAQVSRGRTPLSAQRPHALARSSGPAPLTSPHSTLALGREPRDCSSLLELTHIFYLFKISISSIDIKGCHLTCRSCEDVINGIQIMLSVNSVECFSSKAKSR